MSIAKTCENCEHDKHGYMDDCSGCNRNPCYSDQWKKKVEQSRPATIHGCDIAEMNCEKPSDVGCDKIDCDGCPERREFEVKPNKLTPKRRRGPAQSDSDEDGEPK